MATAERHLLGSRLQESSDGRTYRELARVSSLAQTAHPNLQAEALAALPARGSTLILSPDGGVTTYTFTLRSLAFRQFGEGSSAANRWALVDLEWSSATSTLSTEFDEPDDNGPTVERVGATTESVETTKDRTGAAITVTHDGITVGASVSYRRPRMTVEYDRLEVTNARTRASTYVGKVNSTSFKGFGSGTVFCSSIESRSNAERGGYDVHYVFEIDANGWQPTAAYLDPATGEPPPNLVDGVGVVDVDLYASADFNDLNL